MQHIVIDPSGAMPHALQAFIVPDTREAIGAALDALIARLDEVDGDPDIEDGHNLEDDFRLGDACGRAFQHYGVGCPISDPDSGCEDDRGYGCSDHSYAEWHTLNANTRRAGRIDGKLLASALADEDAEEDDPSGQCDEDGVNTAEHLLAWSGAGCPIGDPDYEHDGREEEHEAEREQMLDDVPALNVVTLEPNLFTGKRLGLGVSNLMSSFVSSSHGVRSADTGRLHRFRHSLRNEPGQPV